MAKEILDRPSGGLVVRTYNYRFDGDPIGGADLRDQAEEVAERYERAGYDVQRWVQVVGGQSPESAEYTLYGIRQETGIKVFFDAASMQAIVHVDCGVPFSLDRPDWRDFTIDVFPPAA